MTYVILLVIFFALVVLIATSKGYHATGNCDAVTIDEGLKYVSGPHTTGDIHIEVGKDAKSIHYDIKDTVVVLQIVDLKDNLYTYITHLDNVIIYELIKDK